MSTVEKKTWASPEEYFAYDASIEGKAEYYDGEIFDMAGGTVIHGLITMNLGGELVALLKGKGCRVVSGDVRIEINTARAYVYPDLSVICGDFETSKINLDTATNPTLVVEVLSKSTSFFDHVGKFEKYRKLQSLKEYVLVEQDTAHVKVYRHAGDNQWLFSEYVGMDAVVPFASLSVTVPLSDIYAGVEFPS